ncbi:hypothetical protein Q9292_06370 [Methylophilus sp. VKM B-3414]|uniref:hypothetical protein n=1 Tax=Methylophilus sp. VKM B-3414 TaxID=3076121 RepID=UPI0028C8C747|nr:hypothetical protein [Methylophilus sp. VKM B-3414]MDT7849229.1 hypothetical protein [Methylophilus sp. VKM B-3414]
MTDDNEESLFKSMESASSEKQLLKIVEKVIQSPWAATDHLKKIRQSLVNGTFEQDMYTFPGPFELFREAFKPSNNEFSYVSNFIVEIERQTHKPFVAYAGEKKVDAIKDLLAKPICKSILWPEVEAMLQADFNKDSVRLINTVVSFEVLLAILAALDVQLTYKYPHETSAFAMLLTDSRNGTKNPTKLLFEFLKTKLGANSKDALKEICSKKSFHLSDSSFDRWSAGSQLPNESNYISFMKANFEANQFELMRQRYYATRLLSYIGHAFQDIKVVIEGLNPTPDQRLEIRPLPDYPFGHQSIQNWLDERYPFWIEYHKERINRREMLPSEGH